MTLSNDSLVLLTVRGTLVPPTLEAACQLHNQTAGSEQGIAAARSLGDLSHRVYSPVKSAPGASEGELMFLDVWQSAEGIGKFFSNPHVGEQAAKMFSKRDGVMWMPARGAFGFSLSAPRARKDRWLGIVRGPVKSPEAAIGAFRDSLGPSLATARKRGQLSHAIYFRIPVPGEEAAPVELLGIDEWYDAEGMQEHYKELKGLDKAFAGRPETSVWGEAAGGTWSEW